MHPVTYGLIIKHCCIAILSVGGEGLPHTAQQRASRTMLLSASTSGAVAPMLRGKQIALPLARGLPGRGLASSRQWVARPCHALNEKNSTPSVMLSGEETDEGDMMAGDYCSIDQTGRRVKKGARR